MTSDSLRVRHFGNTANNAFQNVLLLEEFAQIASDLPIQMFGLSHAISAPAWEAVDFEVPNAGWVASPDWSTIPGADGLNSKYSDLPAHSAETSDLPRGNAGLQTRAVSVARATIESLYGKRWAQPILDLSYRRVLARRRVVPELANRVDVLYGSASLTRLKMPGRSEHVVCLEHGTVRWVADGIREDLVFRQAYRRQIQSGKHLWVTNLDPRTLEVAEDIAPGRWSAFPHPFMLDSRVPFAESSSRRQEMLTRLKSESLVLLPSSQNWAKDHDKGSMTALRAFVELRLAGLHVGLVAVEWGRQVAEAKEFLEQSGVTGNVMWLPPMARFAMQRMMADVDVVWDQFGLEVFGALALRTLEQGTPLVSRGLATVGEQFIGGAVPWLAAATTDEIVKATTDLLEDRDHRGRNTVVGETRGHYRAWLEARHSPALTAALQRDRYTAILDGTFEPGTVASDEWSKLADARLRKNR